MKKKITAIIICAAIAVLVPVLCIATDTEAWKNNTGTIALDSMTVTGEGIAVSGSTVNITKGGDFEVTGECADGMITVNTDEKVKLRLSGMSLASATGPAILFENTEKGFITITEDTVNILADSANYTVDDADAALFSNDDLEIKGSGTLNITGNFKHGIASDDDLKIENGTINVVANEHGLKANNKISIIGGKLDITAKTGKGIKSEEELVIDAGTINIVSEQSEGIESKGIITINGGDINITAKDDGINTGNADTESPVNSGITPPEKPNGALEKGENSGMVPPERPSGVPDMSEIPRGERKGGGRGMDGQPPQMNENGEPMPMPSGIPEMNENDRMAPPERANSAHEMGKFPKGGRGEVPEMGGGFGMVDEETAKAHAVTINGGNIYINANGDGIDSNGNLTINGGMVVIDGPENSGNGPIDAQGTMSISNGEIITLSSAGMIQLPRDDSGLNILKVYFDTSGASGDVVTVKNSDGTEIMTHTAVKNYGALIFASDKLKEENEYNIYVNGELYQSSKLAKGTTTVGNAIMGNRIGMGGMQRESRGQRNNEISVSVNGNRVKFDTAPVLKNDTTLVGFRAILEILGAEVMWDNDTQTVTAKKDNTTIELTIGSKLARVNGEEKEMLIAPEIINNSTMIPVRFISEQLGMTVEWNDATQRITIIGE